MIQININDIANKVRSAVLTGLNTALTGAIVATDTVLEAFGKLQNQLNDKVNITAPDGNGSISNGTNQIGLRRTDSVTYYTDVQTQNTFFSVNVDDLNGTANTFYVDKFQTYSQKAIYTEGDVTTDTKLNAPEWRATTSGGGSIKSSNGTAVAEFGAGGGGNWTFEDGVKLNAGTASRILATDANKNIQYLDTATYPSLTELSYVKGVTSALQPQITPAATTGTVIDFTNPKIFNSVASPATGNITDDLTGAKVGVVQKIYHNHSSAPTVPAGWVLVGAGTYATSTLNIIYAEWASGTRVEYWVVQ
jgi:hypothetical protein